MCVRLLSDLCSCCGNSCPKLAAWPYWKTLSLGQGVRGGWHGGGLGPILAGAGSLPRVERHDTWSEGGSYSRKTMDMASAESTSYLGG